MVKVALLVGVSEYQSGFNPLPSAIEDIKAMKKVLQEKGEFFEVTTLDNPDPYAMQSAIYSLFANGTSEDLVLFYFSGHGIKDHRRKFYLTTSKTTKDKQRIIVPPTAVAASYLQDQMTDSRSERQVIIIDCCYSGAIAQGLTVKGEQEIDIQAELGGKGRAILTSSNSTQESYIQDGSKLSIYTHYLVEGIETGAADLDEDGNISVDELHEYTSKRVQEASPAMTPKFYPVEEGYKIYLARSPIDDPKLKYRKEVERIVKEDEGDIDFITGEIDYLNRVCLDELCSNLGLSAEEAEQIEIEVMQPLRQRQQKLQRYEEVFSEAIKKLFPLTNGDHQKLKRIQEFLGLRDEDIATIEARFTPQLKKESEEPGNLVDPLLQVFKFDVVKVNAKGQEVKRENGEARYYIQDLGNGITLDLVAISGGIFLMGTEDEEIERLCKKYKVDYFRREKPQHEVTVQPFFMGKYPITQAQWRAIASRTDLKVERDLDTNPAYFKDLEDSDRRPVEQVSWYGAVEFCQRLSKQTGKEYRLPSEAEWEYACRSETTTPFHFGETITGKLANYCANETYASEPKGEYRRQTTPVGQFPPNAFGLYDMHGNVWEWCADTWHDNYENAPKDGSAWTEGGNDNHSPLRGGCWDLNPDDCRSAYRSTFVREGGILLKLGFRVVCGVGRTH